jgi:AcrR family transcriptional regulator
MKPTNKQGQRLGRKGGESRRRLLDATLSLIKDEALHKLSASRIAREAGMSSQSFYLYFKDMDDILHALAEEPAADAAEVAAALANTPHDLAPEIAARTFIEAYSEYWNRHRAILNVRNYIADSGNMAFLKLRQDTTMPIIYAVADRILAAHTAGSLDRPSAVARAVIVYLAMERMAARSDAVQYSPLDVGTVDLVQAEIEILAQLFTPVPDRTGSAGGSQAGV